MLGMGWSVRHEKSKRKACTLACVLVQAVSFYLVDGSVPYLRKCGDTEMRIYGRLHFREWLPDQLLGSDASYAPPPGFGETAVRLSVEL